MIATQTVWTATLRVCVDCLLWSQYGWEDGQTYVEGWTGPDHTALLGAVFTVDSDTGVSFSGSQCDGCGTGLAGSRHIVYTYGREEQ